MNWKNFKFFLPALAGLFISVVTLLATTSPAFANQGSIRVCKIITDQSGSIIDGSALSGTAFSLSGLVATTSQGPNDGLIGTSNFTTPLSLNADLLGNDQVNDAQCVTYDGLNIGNYYYGTESINPSNGWGAPKYNDQFSQSVNSLSDFFDYDNKLFDADNTNDDQRNRNADGHIVLKSDRLNRTLIILNTLLSLPAVGGGGPSVSGNITTPQCPANGPQQIDQVWFSNIQLGQVTVHWANKGDASGFHIAYGPSQNNLIWGVEVNDGKANEFTLSNLPGGDVWVSVIAKSSEECGGPASPAVKAQAQKPQVLGATGNAQNILLSSFGLALIALGLWQTQIALKREKRA